MKRLYTVLIISALVAVVVTGFSFSRDDAYAQGKGKGKAQTLCPVQGGQINRSIHADYNGKRIYFCCQGCPEEFMNDPAKYLRKLQDDGVVLEPSPNKGAPQSHKGHKH